MQPGQNSLLPEKALQLEERARQLAFLEGKRLSYIPIPRGPHRWGEPKVWLTPLSLSLSLSLCVCVCARATDQELKRGSTLNIIPPTPIKKTNQSPAVAAAQQAVISTLRQHGTSPQVAPNPVLVPTVPLAATYLHQQLQQPAVELPRGAAPEGEAATTSETTST